MREGVPAVPLYLKMTINYINKRQSGYRPWYSDTSEMKLLGLTQLAIPQSTVYSIESLSYLVP